MIVVFEGNMMNVDVGKSLCLFSSTFGLMAQGKVRQIIGQ